MATIYANDELEKNSNSREPEDYRMPDPDVLAKLLFSAGCDLVKEESEKRRAAFIARRNRFEATHPHLRGIRICGQRGE